MLIAGKEDRGYGTEIAIEALERLLTDGRTRTDTIMINMFTLLRNRSGKDIKSSQMLSEVNQDVQVISSRLGPILPNGGSVLFYALDYNAAISRPLRRVPPPSKAELWAAWAATLEGLKSEKWRVNNSSISVSVLPFNSTISDTLARSVKSMETSSRVTMLSHIACDFHASRRMRAFQLVESFTGEVVKPEDFAEKVLGTSVIPFYPCTHIVLGDVDLIERTIIRKQKKEMIALADKDRWRNKAEGSVRKRMEKAGYWDSKKDHPKL